MKKSALVGTVFGIGIATTIAAVDGYDGTPLRSASQLTRGKTMKRLSVLLLMLPLFACTEKGPLEQLGEEIDEGVEDIRNGGETLGNEIDDTFDDIRNDIEDAVE